MVRRSCLAPLVTVLALAGSGCGGSEEEAAPAPAAEQAAVLVTRECGKEVVVERTQVEAGQTALRALDRVAEIETDEGGQLVTAIDGVEQDPDNELAWLFYVDGEMAEVGAAEVELEPGDVEWWDLHNWNEECAVPAEAR